MKKLDYLVAVDGSEWSDRAAGRAISIAKDTGATVHFLTVLQWSQFHPLYVKGISPPPPKDKSKEEENFYEKILEPLEKRFADSGVDIETKVLWGHPAEEINNQAKEEKASMIFAGRRGRSIVGGVFLGSVANSLAHSAGVPIVLVP
jgi:nucleotide-binding universal stress UspA family protein